MCRFYNIFTISSYKYPLEREPHASMLIELGFTSLEIAGRQTESVLPDTAARRKYLKPYTDCGILNIKKDTCW